MKMEDIDLLDLDRFLAQEHHEMFSYLRKEDPVSWHDEPDGPGFWNIVRHADLIEVNRNAEVFSSETGGISIADPHEHEDGSKGFDLRGTQMLYTDPPKHTRYRKLVNRGFTPRMIGLLEKYLRLRTILIVDEVIEKGSCDFVVDVAAELPLQAIAEIMGVPQEERNKLFEWSNRMIGIEDPEYAGQDNQAAAFELYAYANDLANKRREEPQDDLITRLINAEIIGDDGEPTVLNEQEIDGFRKELKPVEQKILSERILSETPRSLQEIADDHNITREAIRQTEQRILKKFKTYVSKNMPDIST